MGGPNATTRTALESRWVLDGSAVFGDAGPSSLQPGLDVEFRRRIVFHPHTLQLGQLVTDNHWSLDLGAAAEAAGWASNRPHTLAGAGRFGINYNLLNIIGIGPTFRAGYASVSNGDQSAGGPLWSAGLRFAGVIDHVTAFSEIGFLSLPSPSGDSREKGLYGMAGFGYFF